MKRKFVFIFATLLLSACATQAQREYAHINTVSQSAYQDGYSCISKAYSNSYFSDIVQRLPSPANHFQPTMKQLNNDSVPSKDESNQIIAFHDTVIPCKMAMIDKINTVSPSVAMIMLDTTSRQNIALLKLIKRKSTWGEYCAVAMQITTEQLPKLTSAIQQIQTSLNSANADELNRRQAATGMLLQYSAQQQQIATEQRAISALYRPQQTNCIAKGQFLNCNSY